MDYKWVVFHKLLGVASDFIHYPPSCTISYTSLMEPHVRGYQQDTNYTTGVYVPSNRAADEPNVPLCSISSHLI